MATSACSEHEAFRQLHRTEFGFHSDLRSEGDPDWVANGTQIVLFGLVAAQELNGKNADVIGYCDENRRYRVRLHSSGAIKVVAKKNMQICREQPQAFSLLSDLRPVRHLSTPQLISEPAPEMHGWRSQGAPAFAVLQRPESNGQLAAVEPAVSRAEVLQELAVFHGHFLELQQIIHAREQGSNEGTTSMSDVFQRCNQCSDRLADTFEQYERASGLDEELRAASTEVQDAFEACYDTYCRVRSWTELAQDEFNLTRHNIERRGVVATIKQEFTEVSRDVVDVTTSAAEIARRSSQHVAPLVRTTTQSLNESIQTGISSTSDAVQSTRQQAGSLIEEQVTRRIKRVWHLLFSSLILCWLLPLCALRPYHPLNSVVANMGVVWGVFWVFCPPRSALHRAKRFAMLVLWPLVMVALPIAVNYWWTLSGGFGKPFKTQRGLLRRPSEGGEMAREVLIPVEARKVHVSLANDANDGNMAASVRLRGDSTAAIANKLHVRSPRQAVSVSGIGEWWRGVRDAFLRAVQGHRRSRHREI